MSRGVSVDREQVSVMELWDLLTVRGVRGDEEEPVAKTEEDQPEEKESPEGSLEVQERVF